MQEVHFTQGCYEQEEKPQDHDLRKQGKGKEEGKRPRVWKPRQVQQAGNFKVQDDRKKADKENWYKVWVQPMQEAAYAEAGLQSKKNRIQVNGDTYDKKRTFKQIHKDKMP